MNIGHWIRKIKVDAYDINGVKTWGIKCQCDKCDFSTIVVEDFGYYKYCPNCGAKMEGERNMNKEYKTAEEYRQRMIEAFHNADCNYLIAVVCLPDEKEFTHLEWLLKHELSGTNVRPSEELFIDKLEEMKAQIDRHIAELKGENE